MPLERRFADRMIARFREDLDDLDAATVIRVLRESERWDAIRQAAVDSAIERDEVVGAEEHEQELHEARAAADRDADIIDRLHEAICAGNRRDACDLLRQLAPAHPFLSDAAQHRRAERLSPRGAA